MTGYDLFLRRLACHEGGHQVMAATLGWQLGGVTIRGGTYSHGCGIVYPPPIDMPDFDATKPFSTWPQAVQGSIRERCLIALAGDLSALLLGCRETSRSRSVPDVGEQAADLAASLPEPGSDVITHLRELTDGVGNDESDASTVAHLAKIAHVGDLPGQQAFVEYLTTQARAIVVSEHARIERLADWLLLTDTLSGPQVAAMLRE